jgi:hypothetical protein
MDIKLLVIFIILNITNVIIQTIKAICTVKCGKVIASITNAIAYGLYTVVVIYMVCELPLWLKVIIVGGANLIGVFVVKFFEEKSIKDKLWKVEVTIPLSQKEQMIKDCDFYELSHNYIEIEKYVIFNFYCETQKNSTKVKELLKSYNAKYFVSETKNL